MKQQEIIFKKPVKVFQVYCNVIVYEKSRKSFGDRKEETEWKEIKSKNGHISDNELFLPEDIIHNQKFNNCDLIIIVDDNQPQNASLPGLEFWKVISLETKQANNLCYQLSGTIKLDIFKLRNNNGELELFLDYGYFKIGIPERDNFKLCTIRKNNPVEIKINGKTDFSLSSRRERSFREQQYIFEYVGDFNRCKLLKEPYDFIVKNIPDKRKVIDLMKPLW